MKARTEFLSGKRLVVVSSLGVNGILDGLNVAGDVVDVAIVLTKTGDFFAVAERRKNQ